MVITEVNQMFSIPELAMPKTHNVTTVCNGKRVVWEEREEAKDYFIRQMTTAKVKNMTVTQLFIFS